MHLEGSRIVIVGGSSGIGLAVAQAALHEGASVIIAGRSPERLAEAAHRLPGAPETAALDIADEGSVRSLFARVDRIDHVLITVGAHATNDGGTVLPSSAAFEPVLQSRIRGPVHVVRYAAPSIRPGGSITFTTGAATVKPIPGHAFSAAAGGAIEALSRSLAVDLAPVRCNVIRPGFIDTPMLDSFLGEDKAQLIPQLTANYPIKRAGRPEEVADAVLFLMKNEYVTGVELFVDGGFHLI